MISCNTRPARCDGLELLTPADTLAVEWATNRGVPFDVYMADWESLGRKAGPIRNQRMLVEGKPDLVVAFPGGNGTAGMVALARNAGVDVIMVNP
jgi:hypothetical protein